MAFPTPTTALAVVKDPRYRPYRPWGTCRDIFYDKTDEILISGPAGTGKSRAVLEKMHLCACKYPEMRGLMIRKTRTSLTQSAQVTYEKFVIPDNGSVKFRTSEQEYRYSNGSVIVVGGMDKASKVLSSEYDFIYVQEATELTEGEWEILITRNRYGIMPYNQMIADCNPNHPRHWMRVRFKDGTLKQYPSYHEDNPRLFDHATQDWTERGKIYMGKLNKLTGVRRKRLLDGIWAAAEGMIYQDLWNPERNLIMPRPIPRSWRRVWVVDFGFKNPFVWQAWALDEDDNAYRFAELYMTRLLVEDAAAMIKQWKRIEAEPFPEAILCDWDAEGRATLERHLGVETTAASKSVLDGIESTSEMLRVDEETGQPKMFFLRDSELDIDIELKDSGKPYRTEDEFDGYEWADNKKKDTPNKTDDHGMDCTRYFSEYIISGAGGWSRGMG